MSTSLLRIVARSPASVANLGAGYDCIALAVDLWNEYELCAYTCPLGSNTEFTLADPFDGEYAGADARMRTEDGNLFVKAFSFTRKYLCDKAGLAIPRCPCYVTQRVSIPPIRGLGSSSSACVAGTLVAVQFLSHVYPDFDLSEMVHGGKYDAPNSQPVAELQATLAMVHDGCPDNVCASLAGGLTYSFSVDRGRTAPSEIRRLHFFRDTLADEGLCCLALVPTTMLNTQAARRLISGERYSVHDAVFNLTRSTCLPRVLRDRRYDLLREVTRDKLHEEQRARENYLTDAGTVINLGAVFGAALDEGAYASFVSGSGSTLVALTDESRAIAVESAFRDDRHGLGCGTYVSFGDHEPGGELR
jgi:homoserine kinase